MNIEQKKHKIAYKISVEKSTDESDLHIIDVKIFGRNFYLGEIRFFGGENEFDVYINSENASSFLATLKTLDEAKNKLLEHAEYPALHEVLERSQNEEYETIDAALKSVGQ